MSLKFCEFNEMEVLWNELIKIDDYTFKSQSKYTPLCIWMEYKIDKNKSDEV